MTDLSVLQKYSLFDGLEKEQIDRILPLMEQESFEAGTDIIVEGKRSDKLRLILEGRVAVVKGGIILTELDKGDVFGEMEILDVGPVEATITSLAATRVISLSIDAFGEIYESDLKIYSFLLMNLARDLSRRLRNMDSKIALNSPVMDWG
jgi:CRP-like cAMP-binding protein